MEYRVSGFYCDYGARHPLDGRVTVERDELAGVLKSDGTMMGPRGVQGWILRGDPLYFLFHLVPPIIDDIYLVLRHSFARGGSPPSVEGRCYGFWLDINQSTEDAWTRALLAPEYSAIDALFSSTAPLKADCVVDCKLKPATSQPD